MTSGLDDMQVAIVAALKASPDVAALVASRVYDLPPSDTAFPFVEVGDLQAVPVEVDGLQPVDIFVIVHGWTRQASDGSAKDGKGGKRPASLLGAAIAAALKSADLSTAAWRVTDRTIRNIGSSRWEDGLTHHALVEIRILAEAA